MTLLASKKQVVAITELVAGSTPTNAMTTAANADVLLSSAEASFDIDFIDREFLRTTITRLKSIPGQKTGGLVMSFELTGNSDDTYASGVPAWSKFLEMAGFRLVILGRGTTAFTQAGGWDADGTNGPMRHGEIITDGSANTARLVGDVHPGQRVFWFETLGSPMVGSGSWTTGDTEFTITMSASAETVGWAWVPVSEPLKQITAIAGVTATAGAVYQGDAAAGGGATYGAVITIAKTISSDTTVIYKPGSVPPVAGELFTKITGTGDSTFASDTPTEETFYQWPTGSIRLNEDGVAVDFVASRCTASFAFEVNRPVICTITSRGVWNTDDADDIDGAGDTPLLTAAAPLVVDPPLWAGYGIGIAVNETLTEMDEVNADTPCLKSLTLDAGVGLVDVKCAGSTDGLLEIVGATRSGSGSLEANATLETEIPWLTTFRSGEVMRLRVDVGGNITNFARTFIFQVPALQYTGASTGDADGIVTRSMDFGLNAGVMNNLGTGTPDGEISSTSGDNEIILIYSADIT